MFFASIEELSFRHAVCLVCHFCTQVPVLSQSADLDLVKDVIILVFSPFCAHSRSKAMQHTAEFQSAVCFHSSFQIQILLQISTHSRSLQSETGKTVRGVNNIYFILSLQWMDKSICFYSPTSCLELCSSGILNNSFFFQLVLCLYFFTLKKNLSSFLSRFLSLSVDPNALGQHGPDHALIGGVVAVVVFVTLCLIIVLGRYLARHKGKNPYVVIFYITDNYSFKKQSIFFK